MIREIKIKPQWAITSHLLEWLSLKRQAISIVGKDVEKRSLVHCWWINGASSVENMEVTQNIKNRTTIQPSNSTSGYTSKGNSNRNWERYMHA